MDVFRHEDGMEVGGRQIDGMCDSIWPNQLPTPTNVQGKGGKGG